MLAAGRLGGVAEVLPFLVDELADVRKVRDQEPSGVDLTGTRGTLWGGGTADTHPPSAGPKKVRGTP